MRRLVGLVGLALGSARLVVSGRLGAALDGIVGSAPAPAGEHRPRRRQPRILVVSPYSVFPPIHGGAVRILNLLQRLAHHAEVSLLIFGGGTDDPTQRAALRPPCRRVLFQRVPDPDPTIADRWGRLPPTAARYASGEVTDRIAALVEAHQIDIVMLEYTEMGQFAGPYPGARSVLVEHDVSFRSHARQRALGIHRRAGGEVTLGRSGADWLRRFHFELTACGRVDQIHVMSAADRALLARRLADGDRRIRVIPNGVDTRHFHPPDDADRRGGALFVGSFPHLPNQDALEHLVREIWPRVRERIPDASLTVAGARPPQWVLDLDGRYGISVAGEVPDLAPLYRRHRLLAVPIRAGSGTRLKILEAMACGLPVVSTSIGAEGIEARAGDDLLVADDPGSFADAVGDLLEDTGPRRHRLAASGRSLVCDRYDWDRIADRLLAALSELDFDDRPVSEGVAMGDEREAPYASIVIIVSKGGTELERTLDGVARQHLDDAFEVVCVTEGADDDVRAIIDRYGARLVEVSSEGADPQRAVNAGARAARGQVVALLAEGAVPADDGWLGRLVEPFRAAAPPGVVQGGLHVQFAAGGLPFDPYFTAETRCWRNRMGGFAMSLANAAIRRDAWERFPAPPGAAFGGPRWQRMLMASGELILPCWAASVHWVRPLDLAAVARAAWQEGGSWREIGIRYRLADMVADMVRGSAPADAKPGEAAAPPPGPITRAHRLYGVLRPVALFLGNRARAGRTRPGYNATGAAHPHATNELPRSELTR